MRDVVGLLGEKEMCRRVLGMFGTVPSVIPQVGTAGGDGGCAGGGCDDCGTC